MFKSIITAAVVSITALTTSASAMSASNCVILGNAIKSLAVARDAGTSASEAFTILNNNGIAQDITIQLLEFVYISGKDHSGAVLKKVFIETCVGEPA